MVDRKEDTLAFKAVMSARALSRRLFVCKSWSVRAMLVQVRLDTALRSDSVAMVRFASALKVCCCRLSCSSKLAEWKPAPWDMNCDSHKSWWVRAKLVLKSGQVLSTTDLQHQLRHQLRQALVNSLV
jgi:hypothetical protein